MSTISYATTFMGLSPADRKQMLEKSIGMEKKIAAYLEEWRIDVGIFLMGYIALRICQHLEDLTEEKTEEYGQRGKYDKRFTEDEVWITVSTNLVVNTISVTNNAEGGNKGNPTNG